MGEIRTVKTNTPKVKKQSNKMYRLERDKARGETEIYHINGFLLGRHELPWYSGQSTRSYYIDNETMQITEAGKYSTPFQAAEALLKIWESKAGERQARKEKQYQEFLEKPLIKIMLNDYNSLPDDRFKPSTFNIYYSRNIWDYESKYPELRI